MGKSKRASKEIQYGLEYESTRGEKGHKDEKKSAKTHNTAKSQVKLKKVNKPKKYRLKKLITKIKDKLETLSQ